MTLFMTMLGIGLVTSVHCVAMCGNMVLTYAVKDDGEGPLGRRMLPHLAYHAAKIVSYITVGLALGAAGAALDLSGATAYVTLFAGTFMVLLGLQMTGRFPALMRFSLRPPRFLMDALMRTRKRANAEVDSDGSVHLGTPATFGLLTGLMPCAPLQSAQLAAAGTGSAAAGGLAMLGFGLGTMPLMLGYGAIASLVGPRVRKTMNLVAALVIVALGVTFLNRAAMLLGSPVTFASLKAAVVGSGAAPADTASYETGSDGVVEVPLVIENVRFVPQTVEMPAGKPVRLVVERREDDPCSAQIAVPQLGVLADLKPNGVTVVDIPAAEAGSYTLTCGMGMMSGTLSAGGGAASSRSPLILPAAALIAIAGYVLLRRRPAPAKSAGPAREGAQALPFGLTPAELLGTVAAVAAAVVFGLAFGGMLR